MILYPAIDIIDGQAVRLVLGDFDSKTVYADTPLAAATTWRDEGARYLHVVDLDGARTGTPKNLDHVASIVSELGLGVQLGGGLRSLQSVRAAVDAGVERVILGTAAFTDVDFLDDCLAEHGERVMVSVDTRGGFVSTAGWTETTELPVAEAIGRLQDRGVRSFVFTDVDQDGMLSGPDLDAVRHVADIVRGRFIYSGGIGSLADLEALAAMRQVNMSGVISGKALYEKRFSVAEAQAVLSSRRA